MKYRIVVDTNVLFSALSSNRGASFRLLSMIDDARIQCSLSVPLVLEYEEVLTRERRKFGLSSGDIGEVIDYLCSIAEHRMIHYLWRPFLSDVKDDMLLELAVESDSRYIITFNTNDFSGSDQFGVTAITPKEFLRILGELP